METPKNSLHLRKCDYLALILRNLLYILRRKLFLYLGKQKPSKRLIFEEVTFQARKVKITHS